MKESPPTAGAGGDVMVVVQQVDIAGRLGGVKFGCPRKAGLGG
jgi:hypothetical protein